MTDTDPETAQEWRLLARLKDVLYRELEIAANECAERRDIYLSALEELQELLGTRASLSDTEIDMARGVIKEALRRAAYGAAGE